MQLKGGSASVRRQRGFSLVEVMVALVVCAIGLLGLAKMEALGLASTTGSATRSLVALEVGSMAAMMHANRGYWASASATPLATITGDFSPTTCVITTACLPAAMAARDQQAWGHTLYAMIPSYTATIICQPTAAPVTCAITVNWFESTVAINSQQTGITAAIFSATQTPSYTLNVQP